MRATLLVLLLLTQSVYAQQQLTREELSVRMNQAIQSTLSRAVVLEDLMGEGPGAWDDGERYPDGAVNCITWIQLLVAEVYGKGLSDKTPIMDRLRYYGGHVAFGLRKHYTDHWMAFDPAPFVKVDLSYCAESRLHRVDLKPEVFLKRKKYACPLYGMQRTHMEFSYHRGADIQDCIKRKQAFAPGYYVLFAVPSASFLARTLADTGPMGLVHAMVLEVHARETPMLYHASTAAKHVRRETFEEFLRKSKTIHQGYVVYELDPTWRYQDSALPPDDEIRHILECEKKVSPVDVPLKPR